MTRVPSSLAARVAEIAWSRDFEIVPGLRTRTAHGVREEDRLPHFGIPEDLRGKRVLDVGCCDGFFSFVAEERGASVLAVDAWPHRGFFLAREIRGSRVRFRHASVHDLTTELIGEFDVVFFFGVYYHLRSPLAALERLAALTRETLLVESHVEEVPGASDAALARFLEHDELAGDASNWWAPNRRALIATVRAAGFPRAEIVSSYAPNRAVVRAVKGPETAALRSDEEMLVAIDPITRTPGGDWIVTGSAVSFLLPQIGIDRVLVYLDELDEPGARVGIARLRVRREDLAAAFGEPYADCGFRAEIPAARIPPGAHRLHVIAIGPRGWRARATTLSA